MKSDSNFNETLAKRADARFKKEERSKDVSLGARMKLRPKLCSKTERLRALRLAKEAAELEDAAKPGGQTVERR